MSGQRVAWCPQDGSQVAFMSCPLLEVLFHGTRGPGKGLPLGEPVMTPYGETPVGELAVGDWVLCPDGTQARVAGVYPQGVRPTYEITFNDGARARCDDLHLWPIFVRGDGTKRRHPYRVMSMEEVCRRHLLGHELSVPTMDEPAAFAPVAGNRALPVDPYVLGVLLGDGCLRGGVVAAMKDDEIADWLWDAGFHARKRGPNGMHVMACPSLREPLQELGLMEKLGHEKFVPRQYLTAAPEDRLELFRGLMDTDGTVTTDPHCSYTTCSPQLAEDVQYLARSLGLTARVKMRAPGKRSRPSYKVSIRTGRKVNPFRLPRKARRLSTYGREFTLRRRIVSISPLPEQETVCIRVDHPLGLFMTRDFVVTHNTDSLIMSYAQHVGQGHGAAWKGVIFRQTYPQLADVQAKSTRWFRQIFGERARFNQQRMTWDFSSGESLMLRHLQKPADYWNYHGFELPFLGFEELCNWPTDETYRAMFSTCRTSTPNVPRMIRATTNPYGPGHNWVKARFRLGGRWWETKIIRDGRDPSGLPEPPRAAIHGHLSENKILLRADPNYAQTVMASATNPAMAEAWLHGSWDIVAGGMFDDVWGEHCLVPAFDLPRTWRLDRAFDWGSSKPFSVGWWAQSDGSDLLLPSGRTLATVRGDLFRFREWYGWTGHANRGKRLLATEVAAGIVEREILWGLRHGHGRNEDVWVRSGPADSSITNVENGVSVAMDMARPVRVGSEVHRGIHWEMADKRPGSRKAGWELMRQMMRAAKPPKVGVRENPGLFVVEDRCEQFVRTVPSLPRLERDMDDIDTDAEDHVADETRYRVRHGRTGGVRQATTAGWT